MAGRERNIEVCKLGFRDCAQFFPIAKRNPLSHASDVKKRAAASPKPFRPSRVLVIDVGGTNVKLWLSGSAETNAKFSSGATITPQQVVAETKKLTADWPYEAVTIGVPGPVKDGHLTRAPKNLGKGWLGFDFTTSFDRPVRIINDAALQALAATEPGRVLFLGLGTGLGSAMLVDGHVVPLELSELRIAPGRTLEDRLGKRGLKTLGRRRWELSVHEHVAILRKAFVTDVIVVGGGNAKKLKKIPSGARLGENSDVIKGGLRLWHAP